RVASLGPGERVYAQMLADPALRALPPFTIAEVPGVGTARLFTRHSGKPLTAGIPGMFRHRYFLTAVAPAIARYAGQAANENWVTGEAGPAGGPLTSEAGRVKDALVTTYLADFTRRWDEMIDDVVVSGDRPMDERLQVAVRPPSPVKALFAAWADETDLQPPSLTKGRSASALRVGAIFSPAIYRGLSRARQVDSAASEGGPPQPGPLDEVIAHFRWLHEIAPPSGPSPIDDALVALTAVGDTGTAARSAVGLGDPMLQRDKTAAAMAATARLGQVAGALPPTAGKLFHGFVTASTSQLNHDARAGIKASYAQQLYPECRGIVAQGFPFASHATHEASIDDFSRLFRPGGLIDAFQTTSLAGQIDTNGHYWGLTASGRALGLSPAAVRQFQNADAIRRAFFKPGDIRPNVRMSIEPLRFDGDTQAVTLSLDGAPAAFTPTDRHAAELRWPGTAPGVTLSFQHRGSATPSVRTWAGDWAFARMLTDARLSNVTGAGFVATVGDGGASVALRVRMLNTSNPFTLRELAAFACPAGL
ncbi:ImcF-related family protein, partial [Sphingomonas bacterium]|uniref:ImcF-related family protein n=1 Tax=Sphingomonas bacterium TaxID=1895847 RepID=UPI0015773ED3